MESELVLTNEIIGDFLDATELDPKAAVKFLVKFPDLRTAKWRKDSLLHFSAIENLAKSVEFLVRNGWAIDERSRFGNTPLFEAVFARSYASALVLIKCGANVNDCSECYAPPLHILIERQELEVVKAILEAGADPNYLTDANEDATIALSLAHNLRDALTEILLQYGFAGPK
jgi:ankyrin repeat protein